MSTPDTSLNSPPSSASAHCRNCGGSIVVATDRVTGLACSGCGLTVRDNGIWVREAPAVLSPASTEPSEPGEECSAKSPGDGWAYWCELPPGHRGPHAALTTQRAGERLEWPSDTASDGGQISTFPDILARKISTISDAAPSDVRAPRQSSAPIATGRNTPYECVEFRWWPTADNDGSHWAQLELNEGVLCTARGASLKEAQATCLAHIVELLRADVRAPEGTEAPEPWALKLSLEVAMSYPELTEKGRATLVWLRDNLPNLRLSAPPEPSRALGEQTDVMLDLRASIHAREQAVIDSHLYQGPATAQALTDTRSELDASLEAVAVALSEAQAERDDFRERWNFESDRSLHYMRRTYQLRAALSTKDAEIARLTAGLRELRATTASWATALAIDELFTPPSETDPNG